MKKSWKFCGINDTNMIDLSCKMYERNSIETIVENDGILWLNEKHLKKD